MNTEEKIIDFIKRREQFTSCELQSKFNISRAMVHKYMKKLISSGLIKKVNTTRSSYYIKAGKAPERAAYVFRLSVKKDNDESAVFQKISGIAGLKNIFNKQSYESANYIVTEMINNVLDHSKSRGYKVKLSIDSYSVNWEISDSGIGVFNSIRQKFGLSSDEDAAILLLKGKATTYPEKHTGEGIFFSMKLADVYFISSGKLRLGHYSRENPVMGKVRLTRGAKVSFSLARNGKTKLQDIFDKYAGEEFDYRFEKTKVTMGLGKSFATLISRSEAKRLLAGAEKFKVIELDFKGIREIGQGFAHEIFVNFKRNHQDIQLLIINANVAVRKMIQHVSAEDSIDN
ncbi:MAG: DUF4325 domain-containing protein [bacterium]